MSSQPQSLGIASLLGTGTKLWLDSIDPALIGQAIASGVTGATSNPIIVSDLIKSGRFDASIANLVQRDLDDETIAWALTDELVSNAEQAFLPIFQKTNGDDGYVSFELDPLLEDLDRDLPHAERVSAYIELGRKWSKGHPNRMIKVPATPAGLDSLEALAASGVPLNVTLVFSNRQYEAARDAVWRGAKKLTSLSRFKSVYSIFVSRIDVYSQKQVAALSPASQGQVGILNAQRIWDLNRTFWSNNPTPLAQEIIFASTGTKNASDAPWKYVGALAGSDIQTNPPATNDAVAGSGVAFERNVDRLPAQAICDEIDRLVDFQKMEQVLMQEGLEKFSTPQKQLLDLIASKRTVLCS
ncbi:MAG: transaldolase family protein [Pirellulaceae bacterium]